MAGEESVSAPRTAVAILLVAASLAGCLAAPVPPQPTAPAAPWPLIPYLHAFTVEATLEDAGWAVWLWESTGAAEPRLPLSVSVMVEARSEGATFLAGYYPINVARDANGTVLYLSEVGFPLLAFVPSGSTNSEFVGGYASQVPRSAITLQGFILFSEAAATITVRHEQGGTEPSVAPAPVAVGAGAVVRYQLPSPIEVAAGAAPQLHRMEDRFGSEGFVAGAVVVSSVGSGTAERIDATVVYPDGKRRVRDAGGAGLPLPVQCGNAVGDMCRSIHYRFDDFGVSCQPVGTASMEVSSVRDPRVMHTPALIFVPFDHCRLVGADGTTTHPCLDMERSPFRGCPGGDDDAQASGPVQARASPAHPRASHK
jgi:hypothetical protein